jgi:hypothetical protein
LAADCRVDPAEVEKLIAACDESMLQERRVAIGEHKIQ